MTATALIGLQWGDEGKGKIVDYLSATADYVVRCQGGSNAGHTVRVGDQTTILHLIPSGILHPGTRCVIGNGVVVDPQQLLKEIEGLEARGVEVRGRLFLSDRAHVVFPYHRLLDTAQETARAEGRIGTTGRGIGPAYEDKVARAGIRVHELLDAELLRSRLEIAVALKRTRLGEGARDLPDVDVIFGEYRALGDRLRPFVTDTVRMVLKAHSDGQSLFLEGAQGSLLDVDLGTYPFVTSSNAVVGGLLSGSGIPARALSEVLGVAKAYSTRVGEGPYPTELLDATGDKLRERGREFGSTTGRPRRCGWFDAVAVRFGVEVNGVDALALTKADVLSGFETIRICTAYRWQSEQTSGFPAAASQLSQSAPVYRDVPGWSEDLREIREYDRLPDNLRRYIEIVEDLCGAPVRYVSVGPGRDDIIARSV